MNKVHLAFTGATTFAAVLSPFAGLWLVICWLTVTWLEDKGVFN